MTFNHKKIDQILNMIFPLPEEFGVQLFDNFDCEPIDFCRIKHSISKVDSNAFIEFGMSKLVIISPNIGNVVIKIPFNGYFEEDPDTGEIFWNPFEGASGSDFSDYCLTEYEKFKDLKFYGLNCFVAKTLFYKTIDGVRIFLQEKVVSKAESCGGPCASENSKKLANKWYKEGKFDIDPSWIANCLDRYGKSKVEKFLCYCSAIDFDILDDIHSGNFGYRDNGTPVILDFSNYCQ